MAIQGSTKISTYLNRYITQNTKLIDFFYIEYLSDNDTKQFHIMDNIAQNYERFLRPAVEIMELSSEDYRKYRYNPWRLSDDLYGTTELWFMLLHLNELYSATEFDLRTVKVYNSDTLLDRLSEMVNVNGEYFDTNRSEIFAIKKDIDEGIDGMWD